MISRIWVKCLTCKGPITARVQVGHEREQPVSFPCPNCGTEIKLTLVLDDPPNVKVAWSENASPGEQEGAIINIGAGFTVRKEKLHEDLYFPSMDAPRPDLEDVHPTGTVDGRVIVDAAIARGTLPYSGDYWQTVRRALRFQRTGQTRELQEQLKEFWGDRSAEETVESTLFAFLTRFVGPNSGAWISPLGDAMTQAQSLNSLEYDRLLAHYDADLKRDRFEAYSDIFSEYFRAFSEFDQTLVYVRLQMGLPDGMAASSSNFDQTKMFYGNAFEVLGAHLDLPAAFNNLLDGRRYDQMKTMDLRRFRSLNKASRTNCFADNASLSWLVREYDSSIRNASHHRWFRLDDSRTQISYRSGGNGALQHLSYADYLIRCNRLAFQLMILACWELLLLHQAGYRL